MNILDFLKEDSHQSKETSESAAFRWMWSGMPSHVHLSRSASDVSRLCVEYRQIKMFKMNV